MIRGRFDPLEWASDPQRRSDIYDATDIHPIETSKVIKGSPGSAGRVTGIVHLVENPDQGQSLQQGEILVAVQTDVAWTVLFPRAAAVVTDVGRRSPMPPLWHVSWASLRWSAAAMPPPALKPVTGSASTEHKEQSKF